MLPYCSIHSKLVKMGVASSRLKNALQKSCHHVVENSFWAQVGWRQQAGYLGNVGVSVAESVSGCQMVWAIH